MIKLTYNKHTDTYALESLELKHIQVIASLIDSTIFGDTHYGLAVVDFGEVFASKREELLLDECVLDVAGDFYPAIYLSHFTD